STASTKYFRSMSAERGLPERFRSLSEFVERVPPTAKSTIQSRVKELSARDAKPDFVRMTGGTTAEPVRMPAWNSERNHTRAVMWVGRSWYGITPASRLFLLWGHAHLL